MRGAESHPGLRTRPDLAAVSAADLASVARLQKARDAGASNLAGQQGTVLGTQVLGSHFTSREGTSGATVTGSG